MDNPQELKKLIIKQLIEKGEYDKVLSHIGGEEKENTLTKLIKPMSAVADILTENAKGAFMEDLEKRLDQATTEGNETLRKDLEEAHKALKTELQDALSTDRENLSQEVLNRVGEAQETLQDTLARYADQIVSEKADAMFSDLGELARLSEDEIAEIVSNAALEVESQIATVIGDYIAETGITVSQISDFKAEVQKLIPSVDFSSARINWGQIVGAPSQGGTNANLVRSLIAEALADFSGGSSTFLALTDTPSSYTGQNGKLVVVNAASDGLEFVAPPSGTGDMLASVYDPAAGARQVAFADSVATSAQGALADTAVQPGAIANFETTTQLNTRDTNNRNTDNHTSGTTNKVYTATEQTKLAGVATGATANSADATLLARANHTGTQLAATISDFATAVAATAAVTANTAKVTNATHTGDVTGATALTIANSAVTLAKMANLAQDQFIGRTTASTGVPQTATITAAARTVLDDTTVADMVNTLGGATSTGTGGIARANSPVFTTPNIGTATGSITGNAATVTTNANLTGVVTSTGNATAIADAALSIAKTSGLQTALDAKVGFITTTTTSSATPTPTGNAQRNELIVTALATNATIAAPTGTPAAGNMLKLVITTTGSTYTVGYNAALTAGNVTRTTSVPAGKTLVQVYQYQNATWKCHYDDLEA